MEEKKTAEELDKEISHTGDISTDLLRNLSRLPFSEKMRLVMTTNKKKVRALLVKDSNKRIGVAVVTSPNVTVDEIQEFAAMKDLSSDVLTTIADNQRYSSDRLVVWNLLNNPKTPVSMGQKLIRKFTFTQKELMQIARNRDVAQPMRNMAMRMAQAKKH